MAKDVSSKSTSNTNTDDNSSTASDQQKVPPLRIVLNTSGNQKSSSSAIAVSSNQQSTSEKNQDGKGENVIKSSGRVRIKLGTNKQVSVGKGATNAGDEEGYPTTTKAKQANDNKQQQDNPKEEINASFGHLRRITRRSQRSIQTIINDDEESKSSMTSIDENQTNNLNNNNTNNTINNSDNTNSQDNTTQGTSNNNNSATNNTSTSNAPAATAEPTRKYKRRRGEVSESQSCDPHDVLLGFQTYRSPGQNSIELFKNIRKQVDKRLKTLSDVHFKSPHGFRDYMITRGAYLLDGNKLGNGTNLFMNDEGGLHTVPIGKYHALNRHNRVNYSVPNRAKVPLGLPINSPLYNLFIEQEKERYRMQIQHIKEREKLTLAAEQEMIRVHNQAAMAAMNQSEPFSACTMLKHQEIYNYMDSEGVTILSSEDAQQDRSRQPENSNTTSGRTRSREHISPTRPAANSAATTSKEDSSTVNSQNKGDKKDYSSSQKEKEKDKTIESSVSNSAIKDKSQELQASIKSDDGGENKSSPTTTETTNHEKVSQEADSSEQLMEVVEEQTKSDFTNEADKTEEEKHEDGNKTLDVAKSKDTEEKSKTNSCDATVKVEPLDIKEYSEKNPRLEENQTNLNKDGDNSTLKPSPKEGSSPGYKGSDDGKVITSKEEQSGREPDESKVAVTVDEPQETKDDKYIVTDNEEPEKGEARAGGEKISESTGNGDVLLSEEERKIYNRNIFLEQLQLTDDKWEKIRREMLIRHRNEADSLYAVQKLEWEWKTKEIGACDVRTTPIIDSNLVPKLNIYNQDY